MSKQFHFQHFLKHSFTLLFSVILFFVSCKNNNKDIQDIVQKNEMKVDKADENTYYEWNLKNASNVPISSGLYLIHVKAPGLGEKIIRWYGIMQAIDLDSY